MNRCLICGAELVEGKCPNVHGVKPMCLNCVSVRYGGETEPCTCVNSNVLQAAVDKMMAALPEGYEVENLTMKPMVLKDPCKKCKNYEMNKNMVIREVLDGIGLGIEDYKAE